MCLPHVSSWIITFAFVLNFFYFFNVVSLLFLEPLMPLASRFGETIGSVPGNLRSPFVDPDS